MEKELLNYLELWNSVILQLLRDLFIDCNLEDKNKRRIAMNLKTRANNYLISNQEELKMICDYANLNYEFLIERIQFLKNSTKCVKLRKTYKK